MREARKVIQEEMKPVLKRAGESWRSLGATSALTKPEGSRETADGAGI